MALVDDFRVIRELVNSLESAEPPYHTQVNLTDAWKYGVPQHRKRLIVLARKDGNAFHWPPPVSDPVYLRDAIKDLPVLPEDNPVGGRELSYDPGGEPSAFVMAMRADVPDSSRIYDHMTRPVRKDDLEAFQEMNHETSYRDLSKHLQRYRTDQFDDKYKRLDWNNYSRTITAHIAKDGYWYIHPEQHRTLTVREAARIQTFPDSFRFAGTRSDAFRQIGNAVPPLLGRAAALSLHPSEDGSGENRWKAFHAQLARWGDQERQGRSWYVFPGDDVRHAVASVVAVLGPARVESRGLGQALDRLRARTKITERDLVRLHEAASDQRTVERLKRVEALAGRDEVWADADELVRALDLKPAEKSLFLLLMSADVMPAGQGPLRVAARVNGSNSHERNRLTDGRVEIARLIGGGDEAPIRMASLRQLSVTHCLPKHPRCSACPIQRWCSFGAGRPVEEPLY
jgi:DNA (cytosine-5)-methyltransferase 1